MNIKAIAKEILTIGTKLDSNNNLVTLTREYLYPLLSNDSRTRYIGFNLGEYIDWYFTVPTEEERINNMHELLEEWDLDSEDSAFNFKR